MFELKNKTICITGATTGIGLEIATQLAKDNNTLILLARNESLLLNIKEQLQNNTCKILTYLVDANDDTTIIDACKKIKNEFTQLDCLINNIGVSQRSYAIEAKYNVEKQLMQINYFSTILFTKQLIPLLQKAPTANITVMSSMSGLFGFTYRSSYSAAKHALHGYFESMQVEFLQNKIPITISMVCPGRIKTDISLKSFKADGTLHNAMDVGQLNGIPIDVCVKKIINGIENCKKQIIIANNEKYLWYIKRLSIKLFYKIVSHINP